MASIQYEQIFKLFLGSITDYKLASLEEEDAKELMTEYLHKSLAAAYLSRLFSSFELDDESGTFTYSIAYKSNKDETDFVCTAIAKWMVYEWVHNQVNSVVNTAQFFGGAEQKFYSQQPHLTGLRELQDSLYKEARSYIMDRGYISNSYLGGS